MSARLMLTLVICGVMLAAAGLIYARGRSVGVAQERRKAEIAADNAAARDREAEGERQSQARVSLIITDERKSAAALAQVVQHARSAADADEPLAQDRAARLHAADRQLCLGAGLRGCETAPVADAAAGG